MPRPVTDIRVARSFIGHNAANTRETVVLDFDIGAQEAIEIFGVFGIVGITAVPSPAVSAQDDLTVSLHLEDGTITGPEVSATSNDRFTTDEEVIFEQRYSLLARVDAASAGFSQEGTHHNVIYPEPILSVINPSHSSNTSANITGQSALHIHYRYVRLTNDELAFQFARRRR